MKKAKSSPEPRKRNAELVHHEHPFKQHNSCDTDLLTELESQLANVSINPHNPTPNTFANNIIGLFYQKIAGSASPQTLKKIETAHDQMRAEYPDLKPLDAYKGWALGMAVMEGNLKAVLHILGNARDVIHMGHINYAIAQAKSSNQAEMLGILTEYKTCFINAEKAKSHVAVRT